MCLSRSRHLRGGWGPRPGRKAGAARVNFARRLGVPFPPALVLGTSRRRLGKDFPDVREVCSLRMAECAGAGRGLRLKGCGVSCGGFCLTGLGGVVSHGHWCLGCLQSCLILDSRGMGMSAYTWDKLKERKENPRTFHFFSSSISLEETAKVCCELTNWGGLCLRLFGIFAGEERSWRRFENNTRGTFIGWGDSFLSDYYFLGLQLSILLKCYLFIPQHRTSYKFSPRVEVVQDLV